MKLRFGRISVLVVTAFLGSAGCGGTDVDTSTPEGALVLIGQKACAARQRCAGWDSEDAEYRLLRSGMVCPQAEDAELEPDLAAALARGAITYDRAAADACLAGFAQLCADPAPECDQIFVATVADGGGCFGPSECVSGVCSALLFQCGTCTPTVADGGACDVTSPPCRPESFCNGGICSPYYGSYDPLPQVGLGESCLEANCAPDLYCDETEHCAVRRAIGLACDDYEDSCALGSVCADDDTGDYRCRRAVKVSQAGADCGVVGTDYVYCDPAARLECDFDGICASLGGVGMQGDDCYYDVQCQSRRCIDGRCAPTSAPLGTTCRGHWECTEGYCDTSTAVAVCAAFPTCN